MIENAEDKINALIKVIDSLLKEEVMEWDIPEGLPFIIAIRKVIFERYGTYVLKYLDEQIGIISSANKGPWGGKNDGIGRLK